MNASDILRSEHRLIEQVLACLEKMADHALETGRLEAEPAGEALDFFRNFADGCHHGKEEDHYFPAMEAKGFPRQGGPTGVMLHEHELGREHVQSMKQAVSRAAEGAADAVEQFVDHARGFIALLREHIGKEDHCLFTMADGAFTPEDQARLLEQFERVEKEAFGEEVHRKYHEMAQRLARRYGVGDVEGGSGGVGDHEESTKNCGGP